MVFVFGKLESRLEVIKRDTRSRSLVVCVGHKRRLTIQTSG